MRSLNLVMFSAAAGLAVAKPDLYAVLGIDSDVSMREIKQAYRTLSLKWHPDKHHTEEDKDQAQDMFVEISAAYAELSDETKRRLYDSFGDAGLGTEGKQGGGGGGEEPDFFRQRTFHTQQNPHARARSAPSNAYYAQENPHGKRAGYSSPNAHHAQGGPRTGQAGCHHGRCTDQQGYSSGAYQNGAGFHGYGAPKDAGGYAYRSGAGHGGSFSAGAGPEFRGRPSNEYRSQHGSYATQPGMQAPRDGGAYAGPGRDTSAHAQYDRPTAFPRGSAPAGPGSGGSYAEPSGPTTFPRGWGKEESGANKSTEA